MRTTVQAAPARQTAELVARLLGAGLLLATAGIHLYLYRHGYRTVPVIGPSFLLNAGLGGVAALALLCAPQRRLGWVAAGGGVVQAGTLAALLVSLTVGLFGFTESWQAPLVFPTIAVTGAGAVLLVGIALPRLAARRRRPT